MLQAYADEVDVFQATVREREPLPLEWWESRIADGRDPRQLVLGAYVDGRLVGVAGLRFQRRQRTRHKASLFGLYVLPPFQGRGIGRRLVEAVLEQARSTQGTQVVQLKVTGSNTSALRLYESCGFVPFGTEPLAVKVGERFVSMVHMWRRV
jgi:ribosomal protein S18 acetylase RimI-like enzyme